MKIFIEIGLIINMDLEIGAESFGWVRKHQLMLKSNAFQPFFRGASFTIF